MCFSSSLLPISTISQRHETLETGITYATQNTGCHSLNGLLKYFAYPDRYDTFVSRVASIADAITNPGAGLFAIIVF